MVTYEDAKEVANYIAEVLHPLSVILFGSVAKRETGRDLDLIVVTDHRSKINGDADLILHKCLKKFYARFAIDPFIVPLSVLNEYYAAGSPILQKIAKEGRLLYMRDAIQEWVNQAEDELRMAEYLLKGGFSKGTCDHAQQAIEKSIKTRLTQPNARP